MSGVRVPLRPLLVEITRFPQVSGQIWTYRRKDTSTSFKPLRCSLALLHGTVRSHVSAASNAANAVSHRREASSRPSASTRRVQASARFDQSAPINHSVSRWSVRTSISTPMRTQYDDARNRSTPGDRRVSRVCCLGANGERSFLSCRAESGGSAADDVRSTRSDGWSRLRRVRRYDRRCCSAGSASSAPRRRRLVRPSPRNR